MIKIDNLKKSFGDFCAVDGITFSVGQGEVLGFLGPNGAGKSTTMKMLTGFIKPSAGTVSVFGHDIEQAPLQAKRIIGYLPEGAPAYGDMTVSQYLAFIAEVRGFSGDALRSRVKTKRWLGNWPCSLSCIVRWITCQKASSVGLELHRQLSTILRY
ncbi:ATP-binding cassette domain-containing protein [Endozoicomonas lisbonensis]|uniref:ATP-binding cassette domain-containing protein n=1 Tax=Endozoicomonas lisbonensis TaxID=3120522 RepID=UPI003396E8F4